MSFHSFIFILLPLTLCLSLSLSNIIHQIHSFVMPSHCFKSLTHDGSPTSDRSSLLCQHHIYFRSLGDTLLLRYVILSVHLMSKFYCFCLSHASSFEKWLYVTEAPFVKNTILFHTVQKICLFASGTRICLTVVKHFHCTWEAVGLVSSVASFFKDICGCG